MNPPLLLESSPLFSEVAGLPLHPLVVHVAVVVLPLSALALVVLALRRRWAHSYGWLAVAGVAVGAAAAFVAKESGEALAEKVGTPAQHADYGDFLPIAAAALLALSLVWLILARRSAPTGTGLLLERVAAVLMSLVALGTLTLTVLVGHSGAQAVWGDATNSAGGSPATTISPSASTSPSASGSPRATSGATAGAGQSATYTLADVATHADASSCWAAIGGNVYDLTAWIPQHPGGEQAIEGLCGTDATAVFQRQHSGQARPASELAGFLIGRLG